MSRILLQSPWAVVPLSLLDEPEITLADVQVYVKLDHLAGKRGTWYGSIEHLGGAAQSSARSTRRAIERLRRLGYIATKRRGSSHGNVLEYAILARVTPAILGLSETVTPAKFGRSEKATVGRRGRPPVAASSATDGRSETLTLSVRARDVETPLETTIERSSSSAREAAPEKPVEGSPSLAWYRYVVGRDPYGNAERQVTEDYDAAHPPACVAWAWAKAIGMVHPPSYAKRLFDGCMLGGEGHGPRAGKDNRNGRGTGNGAQAARRDLGAVSSGDSGRKGGAWIDPYKWE